MKVLITGASGFLGQYVLDCLNQRSIPYVAAGRRQPVGVAAADFIDVDLLQHPALAVEQASGVTHLLHLAWYVEHRKYWHSPLNLRWVDATVRLVEAFCAAGGRHVVVAGSGAEYAWTGNVCDPDSSPLIPGTLYGVAKDATRRLILALCAANSVRCVWARVFMLHGAGEAPGRLVPSLIDVFQNGSAPFSVDTAAQRDFLHAADVASGFMTLLQSPAEGAFNLCSGEPVALGTVAKILAHQLHADPAPLLALNQVRENEPRLLVGDNTKLRALGWRPRYDLAGGLARTIDEYKITSQKACL
ncbi:MAG: NAD(P)-dependent oxidoreductase [Pseudomonadota bacterium]